MESWRYQSKIRLRRSILSTNISDNGDIEKAVLTLVTRASNGRVPLGVFLCLCITSCYPVPGFVIPNVPRHLEESVVFIRLIGIYARYSPAPESM
jgi:hypothetical protein